jgi:hypothetical protein
MGIKTKCLDEMKSKNINVHIYEQIDNIEDLKKFYNKYKMITVRFDNDNQNIHKLPFYKITNDSNLEEIAKEAKKYNCTMLCSNGLYYDKYLLYNFVYSVNNDEFILEICNEKVPLREMYKYKLTTIKGNISEDKFEYIDLENNKISKKNLNEILALMLKLNIKDKTVEATLYSEKVGIYKEKYVIWQIY